MKKKVTMWMTILAIAVSPMLAQEADTTSNEKQQQVDQAIEEATGEVWVDENVPEEAVPAAAAVVVTQEPEKSQKPQHRQVQTLMPESGGSGGYGAFSVGYTTVNNLDALEMGIRGAWIIGHGFALGFAGQGFTSDFTPIDGDYYALSGGYGGLLIEPIIFGWFPVHITLPLLIGGGGLASYATSSDPWDYDNFYPTYGEYAAYFVGEVGIEVEFNMVRFFRLALYSNYRWTSALDMKPMDGLAPGQPFYTVNKDALNGFSFGMRFKFGSF